MVYVDYESNTPRAVQATERMITQDKVTAIFGPYGSGAVKASSSVTERYRIPMLAATASSTEVYNQGYKFIFGTLAPNSAVCEPLAEYMRGAVPNLKRIRLIPERLRPHYGDIGLLAYEDLPAAPELTANDLLQDGSDPRFMDRVRRDGPSP